MLSSDRKGRAQDLVYRSGDNLAVTLLCRCYLPPGMLGNKPQGQQARNPDGDRAASEEDRLRVLVVEDHAKLAQAIAAVLRREGMAVDVSFDGDDALAMVAVNRYDVIVLDRDLPGRHGDDVCQTLVAEENHSGLLMLTASSTIEDKVEGLGIGADDYLAKPFNIAELVARIVRWPAGAGRRFRLSWCTATCAWTPPAGSPPVPAGRWTSAPRNSPSSSYCWPPEERSCQPRTCWNRHGTRRPTRSPIR